ncbi:MAG: hypothetical protein KatS3mg113_0688 [Planctomycetaceae bacterium]|nr:MAG: hypothetical protein KatS3mg113_0688 [Planctomycetaceae bacterium]
MRVALVILNADARRGGAERYTLNLARSFWDRGIEVSLICIDAAEPLAGCRLITFPCRGIRTQRYLAFCRELHRHLQSTSYDIVHAALPVPQCDVYHPHAGLAWAAWQERWREYPRGWQWWGWCCRWTQLRRWAQARIEKQLLSQPSPPVVLCLSQLVEQKLLQYYSLAPQDWVVLTNGVDTNWFHPTRHAAAGQAQRVAWGCSTSDRVALLMAHDFARKGVRQAIAALAHLTDPRWKLVVVGKARSEPWQRWAQVWHVEHRVIFAGATQHPETCYAAADLLLLPTPYDSCSLVVLEALAMHKPVITTVTNGAADVMVSGKHGWVLQHHANILELACAWNKLADDATRLKMSAACGELRPRLSWETHVEQLLALYRQIQERRRLRGSTLSWAA